MLKTFSGTPYLSVEQREHFEQQKKQLLEEMPELLQYDDIHRWPLWTLLDWKTFLKHDCHQIGVHPIHTAFQMLFEYRRTYNKRMYELQCAYESNTIDAELYECLKFEMNMNLAFVESEFDVKAKKDFDIRYGDKVQRAKFTECLQRTIAERLSAFAERTNQNHSQATA